MKGEEDSDLSGQYVLWLTVDDSLSYLVYLTPHLFRAVSICLALHLSVCNVSKQFIILGRQAK